MDLNKFKTDLDGIWDTTKTPKEPKSPTLVPSLSQNAVTEIKSDLESVSKMADVSVGAKKLAGELEAATIEIEIQRRETDQLTLSNNQQASRYITLRQELDGFQKEMRQWRMLALGIVGVANDNARAQYASAGQWAMHYSVVG